MIPAGKRQAERLNYNHLTRFTKDDTPKTKNPRRKTKRKTSAKEKKSPE